MLKVVFVDLAKEMKQLEKLHYLKKYLSVCQLLMIL